MKAKEIAEKAGLSRRYIQLRAKKEQWPRKFKKGNGGIYYDFDLRQLPIDIQALFEPKEMVEDKVARIIYRWLNIIKRVPFKLIITSSLVGFMFGLVLYHYWGG